MPIRFHCNCCNARIKVPDGSEGRKVRCPACAYAQKVPAEADAVAASAATARPKPARKHAEPADNAEPKPVSVGPPGDETPASEPADNAGQLGSSRIDIQLPPDNADAGDDAVQTAAAADRDTLVDEAAEHAEKPDEEEVDEYEEEEGEEADDELRDEYEEDEDDGADDVEDRADEMSDEVEDELDEDETEDEDVVDEDNVGDEVEDDVTDESAEQAPAPIPMPAAAQPPRGLRFAAQRHEQTADAAPRSTRPAATHAADDDRATPRERRRAYLPRHVPQYRTLIALSGICRIVSPLIAIVAFVLALITNREEQHIAASLGVLIGGVALALLVYGIGEASHAIRDTARNSYRAAIG